MSAVFRKHEIWNRTKHLNVPQLRTMTISKNETRRLDSLRGGWENQKGEGGETIVQLLHRGIVSSISDNQSPSHS